MKTFTWNPEKNEKLMKERGVSFEVAIWWIENERLIGTIEHPNKTKYPNQRIFIVNIEEYVHFVPFVESDTEIFLKTIIPSRKMNKKYLKE